MERRALSLRKRDLFRINHVGMLLERMRAQPGRLQCELAVEPDGAAHRGGGEKPNHHVGPGRNRLGKCDLQELVQCGHGALV